MDSELTAGRVILFGWKPDPTALLAKEGVDRMIATVGHVRARLQLAKQQHHVSRWKPYEDEDLRLASLSRDRKERKVQLHDDCIHGPERFGRTFRRVVLKEYGKLVFQQLVDATNAMMESEDAQRSTVENGRALAPIGGGGGMRTRRSGESVP